MLVEQWVSQSFATVRWKIKKKNAHLAPENNAEEAIWWGVFTILRWKPQSPIKKKERRNTKKKQLKLAS